MFHDVWVHLRTVFTDPITLGVIGFFALLAALEALAPRRVLPAVPRWRMKGAFFLLLSIAVSASVPRLWDAWLAEHRLVDARALGDVGGALVGFTLFELALYFWHRALHRSDFLWRWFHQMHHSAERVDVFGAYYFHPFDVVGFSLLTSVSLVGALGLTANAALYASLAITAAGLFQHANLRTPRWLGFVIQRPESHAVHHERGVHAGNYSDLPLWDLLFRTFRNPATHAAEAGFHDGASRELGALLLGRDVAVPRTTLRTARRERAEPRVRSIEARERERALSTLVDAFAGDPVARWTWPDEDEFRRRFPLFAAALGGRAFAFATADAADDLAAAALWIPPAVAPDEKQVVESITAGAASSRCGEILAVVEQMARFHPAEPHWYLPLIGVRPNRQGEGLGGALLRHGLARCDADRLPAYLEATSPKNVPLYERHGFRAIGSIRAGDCPPLVPMVRPPRVEGTRAADAQRPLPFQTAP